MKNICYIVHTCDNYKFSWKFWYYFFRKYWTYDIPIYFVNESIPVEYKGIKTIHTGPGEWSNRLMIALKRIPEKYVIYSQEDMWLNYSIDIPSLYKDFLKYNMDCLRLTRDSDYYKYDEDGALDKYSCIAKHSKFIVTHQISIWKKKLFMKSLRPNQSPWVHESKATKWIRQRNYRIYQYNTGWYTSAVCRGEFNEYGIQKIKEEYEDA